MCWVQKSGPLGFDRLRRGVLTSGVSGFFGGSVGAGVVGVGVWREGFGWVVGPLRLSSIPPRGMMTIEVFFSLFAPAAFSGSVGGWV